MAGILPALVIVEMLSDDGEALNKDAVSRIADELGTVVISGGEIIREAERQGIIKEVVIK